MKIGRILLTTLLPTLVTLVVAEGGVRLYYHRLQERTDFDRFKATKPNPHVRRAREGVLSAIVQPSANDNIVYELIPNLDMQFGHKSLRTNSFGMRDRPRQIEKPSGVIRVAGIGDSGMFGWGTEQGENYLAVLEELLNREDTTPYRYEVLNFAVPGYNTGLEVEQFKALGRRFKPDVVIVGWSDNDWGMPYFLLEKEDFTRLDRSYFWQLIHGSLIIASLRRASTLTLDRERVPAKYQKMVGEEGVARSLTELMELGHHEGFEVILLGVKHPGLAKVVDKVGIPTLDLLTTGREYPDEAGVLFMHPRPLGHRIIAEVLAEHLRSTVFPRVFAARDARTRG